MRLDDVKAILSKLRAEDPLRDFHTWWDSVSSEDLVELQNALDSTQREEDIQQFLQARPKLLIQHFGGGHGRWVIPKVRLGSDHVTDFLVAEKHSFGYEWQAVELESPKRPMFNKNGDPSSHLNHAIRQVTDWRAWLKANQSYATRSRDDGGLGLTDIDTNVRGLILIDRRVNINAATNARRRQMVQDLNIDIHSYDYLVTSLEGRLRSLNKIDGLAR